MKRITLFVIAIWLSSALFCQIEVRTQEKRKPDTQRKSQAPASPAPLPGAKGPLYEYVGADGPKVTGADVSSQPIFLPTWLLSSKHANPDTLPKTRTLPSGTRRFSIAVRFEAKPTSESISVDVYNKNGKVESAADVTTTAVQMDGGEYALGGDFILKAGKFGDGPYQAKVKLGDRVVALINWQMGESRMKK